MLRMKTMGPGFKYFSWKGHIGTYNLDEHKSTIPCIAWHFQITRQDKMNQFACMVMVGELDNTEQTVCGSAWLEQYFTISYSQPYPYGTKVTKSSKKCRSNAQIVSCVEISIKPDIMHANASTACIFLHIICTWLPEIGSRLCTTEKGEMCDNLLCATCDKVRKPVACFTKPTTRFTKSVQHFCVIFSTIVLAFCSLLFGSVHSSQS